MKKAILLLALLLQACGGALTIDAFPTATYLMVGQSNMADGRMAIKFAQYMLEHKRPITILIAAQGSTRISCWRANGACFDASVTPYTDKQIEGIVYWQGESDGLGNTYPSYGENLAALIVEYRAVFGEVPFYMIEMQRYNPLTDNAAKPGDVFDEPIAWSTVREGQYDVLASDLKYIYLVHTTDITYGAIHPIPVYDKIAERLGELVIGETK